MIARGEVVLRRSVQPIREGSCAVVVEPSAHGAEDCLRYLREVRRVVGVAKPARNIGHATRSLSDVGIGDCGDIGEHVAILVPALHGSRDRSRGRGERQVWRGGYWRGQSLRSVPACGYLWGQRQACGDRGRISASHRCNGDLRIPQRGDRQVTTTPGTCRPTSP